MDFVMAVFGDGEQLNSLQMSMRALTVFVAALIMLRVAGRRSFGQRSPFDACTAVLIGAVLSRAVVGASPFLATLCAAASIVLLHRLFGWLSARSDWFDQLASGEVRVLMIDGQENRDEMRKAQISDRDLAEAIRKKIGKDVRSAVTRATLERDGAVTIEAATAR